MISQSIGHYKILDKLGAGGMGEVYRAEDTTLGRHVAIKVLPEAFTSDPERLARFEREAKLLATLNHPHIAQIHALEDVDGQKLLVMELVDGETLAEHISRGPIALESALAQARQIAEALEAAHERGIIHRDLKPANIKITPDGEVKVLDFGLAKPITDSASADLTHSPTLTYSPTQAGVLLGTVAYMSPEQARGQEVDKRTDIWALGVVLWEMLTGKPLFGGETVSDVLAAVLRAEPQWQAVSDRTPPAVLKLLSRCLTRDPRDRLHDVADARIELEEAIKEPDLTAAASVQPTARRVDSMQRILWALVGAALATALGVVGWLWFRPEPGTPQIRRFQLNPPSGVTVSPTGPPATLALSPDGKWVAFRGQPPDPSAPPQIYLRSVEELEAHPVEGTERARNPFFSADSRWLGFAADDVLKKVPVEGGEPFPICAAPKLRGASWGADGVILFNARNAGLLRVSADGGEPEVVTVLDSDQGEDRHRWPQLLPGGQAAIFLVREGFRQSTHRISVVSLETGEYRTLLTGGTYGQYLRTGHLLYSRLGSLYAVPFDLDQLELTGRPQRVLEDVYYYRESGFAAYSLSESGSLVYVSGAPQLSDRGLVWLDRKGNVELFASDRKPFVTTLSFSPDPHRLAVEIQSTVEDSDIWIHEAERGSWTRLTFKGGSNPIWSADGRWVIFCSDRTGAYHLFRVAADGSGNLEQLTADGLEPEYAESLSPDGKILAFRRQVGPSEYDLMMLSLEGERRVEPLLATPHSERDLVFSPDGDWMAYRSDESGQDEVYVQPFPGPGPKMKLSTDSGRYPAWSPSGEELFYLAGGTIWVVPVQTGPEFVLGRPEPLFEEGFLAEHGLAHGFEVSPDGERFLTLKNPEEETPDRQIVYVPNWAEEIALLMEQKQ